MAGFLNISTPDGSLKPVSTGQVLNGGYTVPVGYVARIVATLQVSSSGYTYVSGTGANGTMAANSNSSTVELWLKANDSITIVNTATGSSGTTIAVYSCSPVASLSVNGTIVSKVTAPSTGYLGNTPGSAAFTGTADVSYRYELFNA